MRKHRAKHKILSFESRFSFVFRGFSFTYFWHVITFMGPTNGPKMPKQPQFDNYIHYYCGV